jgi:preprotein translocase subunit YajC
MEPLIVFAVPLVLLWALFIYPQQRRVRAHHQLVASLAEGDEVVLSAGIFGRIVGLGPDELALEVAPGVELRVARQAVLRLAEATDRPAGEGDAEVTTGPAAAGAVEDSADEGDRRDGAIGGSS